MSKTKTARGRLAALTRHREPGDPAIEDARRDLRAVRLEDHVKRVVDDLPPLTDEQVSRLTLLLRGGS